MASDPKPTDAIPEARWGTADAKPSADWREATDAWADDDSDTLPDPFPQDVIDMLGFDPTKSDEDATPADRIDKTEKD